MVKKTTVAQEKFENKVKEKYIEYQMIEEQTKKMQEQLETFNKQIEDLQGIEESLCNITDTKSGTEIYVPVSSGIFIKAEIRETKEVLVNVGDNVVVAKKIEDAITLVKKQQDEIKIYKEKLKKNTELLIEHSKKIEEDVLKLAQSTE